MTNHQHLHGSLAEWTEAFWNIAQMFATGAYADRQQSFATTYGDQQ